jgi:ABC-type transporter Mla subunit MlaD
VEPNKPYVRFLWGVRKYAVAVLLLCGIAGTLFSLHDVIQLVLDSADGEKSKALAGAFYPSICGVIGTLILMAIRYSGLEPAQDCMAREMIAFAGSVLIPWKLRNEEAGAAASDAAMRLGDATRSFAEATQESAVSLATQATEISHAVGSIAITMRESCETIIESLRVSAAEVKAAGESSISGMTSATKQVGSSLSALGKGLAPVTEWMNKSAQSLAEAADRFDNSVAANGPFLKAMEQLYDSVSPAEARYEKLLLALIELQKLNTTQNVELARLYRETAGMGQGVIRVTEESSKLASSLQSTVDGLPKIADAVRGHSSVLSLSATSWEQIAVSLSGEVKNLGGQVNGLSSSHDQAMKRLLDSLPNALATVVASSMQASSNRMIQDSHLNDLKDSIDGLQVTMRGLAHLPVRQPKSPISTTKRWYQVWKKA